MGIASGSGCGLRHLKPTDAVPASCDQLPNSFLYLWSDVGRRPPGRMAPGTMLLLDHPLLPWQDVDLGLWQQHLPVPLRVGSNVHADALADMIWGHVPSRDFAHLYVGNMVELGLVVEGHIRDTNSSGAATVDDVLLPCSDGTTVRCGDVLTDRCVVAKALDLGIGNPELLLDRPLAEQPSALRRLLEERARNVGEFIVHLSALIPLQDVVVSSGVLSDPHYIEIARSVVSEVRPQLGVIPGGSLESSLLQAGAAVGLEPFLADPLLAS